jgi:hypothetical protein
MEEEQARVESSDTGHWARPVDKLSVGEMPSGAINLNVAGRKVAGALQGFGQLWQKTFKVRLSGVQATPEEVMQLWRENFARFQPATNHFYPSLAGFRPGEVILIDSKLPVLPGLPGMIPIAAGVMVLYADDTTLTVMTPEGFPVAGWNNFSTYEEDGAVVAQVQSVDRPSDPIYEFGFRLMGGTSQQDQIWVHVLEQVAAYCGVRGQVQTSAVCLDSKVQWKYAKNIWHNAAIRTTVYALATPFRMLGKALRK